MCEKLTKGPDPVQVLHSLNIFHIIFRCFYCRVWTNNWGTTQVDCSGFELTYRDSGNTIHFSFFTIQVFPPTQKITIPKKVSVSQTEEQNQNSFLLLRLKTISIDAYLTFIKVVMLFLFWHKILFSSINWSQFL